MNINLIVVGKIKEKYLKVAIEDFLKRIKPYSSIKITEIPSEILKDLSSEEKAREIEAQKINNLLNTNSFVIALDVKGQNLSSEEFAEKIKKINHEGHNQLIFLIGGAVGLDKSIMEKADLRLSISKMTFTHQMVRLILLEQIYRTFKIINNEPYHK
ncbi:MAG: 23S rRNA (pseudouridine(1915)-N(3))-methyltransferase RlmH [Candidatus Gastranaerophilaceae bacterium]|jgi:23S rRNA (pseudouridine1915-N3)-methyltransferase